MQDSQYPDPAAQVLWIVCELYQRLGCSLHQQRIHPLLIAAKDRVQCVRDRHCDMKIIARQQFSGALLEPLMYLVSVTGRAVPVYAYSTDLLTKIGTPSEDQAHIFGACLAVPAGTSG